MTIDDEQKIHVKKFEKFVYCIAIFALQKCKIKFFSRIVTISFSERSNGGQNNRMNCGQKNQRLM